ncbi:MAG: BACON domain-containing carbohydrate-binding protein, partial [Candidatus Bipolaricaulota bacterium]
SGSGNATVGFTVEANPNTSSRTGTLTVATKTVTVTQNAAPVVCVYSVSPTNKTIAYSGGSDSVSVTTSPTSGCAWTATSNVGWITIASGSSSGSGNATVGFTVEANPNTSSRTGTLTVATKTVTVTQNAAPVVGTYYIESASASPDSVGSGSMTRITMTIGGTGGGIPVLLGASLRLPGKTPLSDPAHDGSAFVGPGSTPSRLFSVPVDTPSGTYDLLVSLVDDTNGDGRIGGSDRTVDLQAFTSAIWIWKFDIDMAVRVYNTGGAGLRVRSNAGTSMAVVGTVPDGTTGSVLLGPVPADGYYWWCVRWATGIAGWSVEDYVTSQ